MLKLSLNDPIKAEIEAIILLMLYQESKKTDKQKIRRRLQKAIKQAQVSNHTFVASLYRTTYAKLRGTNQ